VERGHGVKVSAPKVFLLWLALMLAGAAVVWNSRITADMSFFLPSRPTAEQQALVGQLRDGTVSRLLMLSIEGGDVPQRAALSRAMRQRLASDPAYVSVQNGEAGGLEGERDLLLRHRYALSPAVSPERFTTDGLRSAVADTIDLLTSPAGGLLKPYLLNDPTGEVLAILGQLNPASQPQTRGGVWASRNGERAMLLLQTRALGSDTDGQAAAIAGVQRAFEHAVRASGLTGLTMQMSGPGQFAVQSREIIKRETSRLFLVSMLGIAGVLLWVYRSPRLLALGLLPMLSGALAGVVAVSLVHGEVFGITVGFGSALIGEAVDYAIYFFVQSGRMGLAAWRARFWPTVRLGVMTSALGFGALLFSGFPGLSQLGLYALSGLLTAALVTRFVLPVLAGAAFDVPPPGAWVHRGLQWLGHAHRLRVPVALLAVLALAFIWQQRKDLWHTDLSSLSTVSQAEAQSDARMRDDLAAPDARYLVSIRAPDAEQALQAAERAGERLDRLVEEGVIGGYDSPARFLPSARLQQQRLASLPDTATLSARLVTALQDAPLSAARLGPFVADVQAARVAGAMRRADLEGSALALAVDSMLMPAADGGWNVMMPLRPAPGTTEAGLPVQYLRQALEGSGAVFVDLKTEFEALYGGYVAEAVKLSLAGFAAIVLLLALALRSIARLLRVLLALVLTVVVVIVMLRLSGQSLHLLHLVGLLLTVAVGSNYALFFDRAAGGDALDPPTLMSLLVATLTTAIGFGTLATSPVPVLNAIGTTVGPGTLLALLLAAVVVYPRARP
jgi:predicted exporter